MFDSKYYIYAENKFLYHAILIISFVIAIKIIPWTTGMVAQYIEQTYLQQAVAYLATYVAAMYVLPEVGFMIAKAVIDKN